jgi:hypothetical protein
MTSKISNSNALAWLGFSLIVLLLFTTVIFAQKDHKENVYDVNLSQSSINGTALGRTGLIDVQLYYTSMRNKIATMASGREGLFMFGNLYPGEYIVKLSIPGYYDHPVAVSLREKESKNIGEQYLQLYPAENDFLLEDPNTGKAILPTMSRPVPFPPEIDSQHPMISAYRVLTVCDYLKMRAAHPLVYVQWGVIIIGNLVQTPTGSWLQQSCGNPVKAGDHSWPDAIFFGR